MAVQVQSVFWELGLGSSLGFGFWDFRPQGGSAGGGSRTLTALADQEFLKSQRLPAQRLTYRLSRVSAARLAQLNRCLRSV